MTEQPTVNSVDLRNIADDLEYASELSGLTVHQMLLGFASEIQADMQQRAHVVTGRMRSHIQVKDEPGAITVGVPDDEVPYAKWEAYGTRPHEIRAKPGKTLSFVVNGRRVFVKKVQHPGHSPHDFVTPAILDFVDKLGPDAAKVGVNLIMGDRDGR